MDNKTTSKTKAILIALIICVGIVIVGVIVFFQYQKSVIAQKVLGEVKIETTERVEDTEEELVQVAEDLIKEEPMEPEESEIMETEESGTLYTVERTVMYKLPDEDQDAYVYLPTGCEVEVLAKTENGYTKVRYGLKKGYLKNELLTAEVPEISEEGEGQPVEAQSVEEKANNGDTVTTATSTPTVEQQAAAATAAAQQQAAAAAAAAQQQAAAAAAASAPAAPVTAADAEIAAMWGGDTWGEGGWDTGYADFN